MLKKMLHTFAAKFLTLALVLTALTPFVGGDASNAAPDLMANVDNIQATPVISEETGDNINLISDLNSAENNGPDGQTLKVSINSTDEKAFQKGGFKVYTLGSDDLVYDPKGSNYEAGCPLDADGYTCSVTLKPNGYNVKFNDVPGYQKPTAQAVQIDGYDDHIIVTYVPLENNNDQTNFLVQTKDNQGNPLNEQYVRDALTTHATPDAFVAQMSELDSYSFEFKNKPGYTTPGTVVVNNKIINSIPSNVTITENGNAYAPGTVLKANTNYVITGIYVKNNDNNGPLFTIDKQVTNEVNLGNGNKQFDYQITVTRNANGQTGNYNILVDDTINDNGNRTLYGSNGGTMTVVQVNGNYSTCSNGCGDITLNPVNIMTTQPGQVVTLTYRTQSNNNTIPDNQNSNFTNTVLGKYNDGNGDKEITDKVTVNVPGDNNDNDDDALFTIDKKVTNTVALANDNKRIYYQITITRDNNGPSGNYNIEIDDTVNDNGNRTLYGSNGGTLKVVKNNNNTYSTCSNGCGDITAGPVTVKTTQKGQVVTINYIMESDNSTIPDNETSNFTNTVVGKYFQNGEEHNPSDKVTVNVPGNGDDNGNLFTVDKQVLSEQLLANGNKHVKYQITVKRNSSASGTYYILVDDTINDNGNRTLNGTNGGTLTVVPVSGVYSTCSNGCGDITAGPVNVKTTSAGQTVTLTYEAETNNNTVPAGQTSNFTNTVVGKYTQDGKDKQTTDQVTVTTTKNTVPTPVPYQPTPAPAPPTPTPPRNTSSGPGNILILLALSAAGAYGWQVMAQRKKASVSK